MKGEITKTGDCEKCHKETKIYACHGEWCAGPTMIWLCWGCTK